jgi:hypothetical protein
MEQVAGLYNQPWLQERQPEQEPIYQSGQVLKPNVM